MISEIKIYFIILILIIASILWCLLSFHKLKQKEAIKLQLINQELDCEKGMQKKLIQSKMEFSRITANIHEKLLKIKIDIFNLDFTLTEIFHS